LNALRFAITICPAQSKRGLLAQIRELADAALCGDTDRTEHLVTVIRAGVDNLVSGAEIASTMPRNEVDPGSGTSR
jgi:hypothetical protein